MKKLIWILAFMGILAGTTHGAGGDFGLGFALGNPSGLSAKISLSRTNSVNLLLGYDLNRRDWNPNGGVLYLGGDYLWHNYDLIHVSKGRLPLYYGPGVNVTFSGSSRLGIRGLGGLEYQFANAPFDVFLEIGPGIHIMPNTEPDVSGGFGGRFFF